MLKQTKCVFTLSSVDGTSARVVLVKDVCKGVIISMMVVMDIHVNEDVIDLYKAFHMNCSVLNVIAIILIQQSKNHILFTHLSVPRWQRQCVSFQAPHRCSSIPQFPRDSFLQCLPKRSSNMSLFASSACPCHKHCLERVEYR